MTKDVRNHSVRINTRRDEQINREKKQHRRKDHELLLNIREKQEDRAKQEQDKYLLLEKLQQDGERK